jgi:hypothetical protein
MFVNYSSGEWLKGKNSDFYVYLFRFMRIPSNSPIRRMLFLPGSCCLIRHERSSHGKQ